MSYARAQRPATRHPMLDVTGSLCPCPAPRPWPWPGLGTYTMSDFTIWSGSEVQDEIRRFGNEVTGTNGDVDTHRNALISAGADGTRFWNEWQIFMRDWNAYRSAREAAAASRSDPMIGTSSTSVIVSLRALVDRYNALETRYRALTGVAATVRSGDTRPSGYSLPAAGAGIGLLVAGTLGTIALVSIAFLSYQARKIVSNKRRRKRTRR